MKVERINHYKEHYKEYLKEDEVIMEAYKYDALNNFQNNWDLGELDLKEMFNRSLSSKLSGRLWAGSTNSPKSVMLSFIDINKEFVRSTFRDLFNESKDVVMRMQRFSFHCDQLLRNLLDINKKIVSHKHNPRMVTVYLALRYPDKYNVYDYQTFTKCLHLFDSANIPLELEIDKYFRLSNSVYKILAEDEELMNLHESRIRDLGIEYRPGLFMVHDFFEYLKINSKSLVRPQI